MPFVRRAAIALVLIAVSLPALLWGVQGSMSRVENAPAFWLPSHFSERERFDEFLRRFGVLDVILVSWEGCTLDDPRLEQYAKVLQSEEFATSDLTYRELFAEVLAGYTVVRQLMEEPLRLNRAQAEARLQGILLGRDGQTSCAVVSLTRKAGENRQQTIDILREVAQKITGLPDERIFLAGSVVDGAAIDLESVRALTVYGLPSALLSLLICWMCLRSWLQTLAVVAVAAVGQGFVLAIVWYTGVTMNAVLAVMAPLVFVVTISGGVHLSNYFTEQLRLTGPSVAVQGAIRAGWLPCVVAGVTTAIGTASLMLSEIVPVRQFGLFASMGILLTLGLLFVVVPGAMEIRALWFAQREGRSCQGQKLENFDEEKSGRYPRAIWSAWSRLVVYGWGIILLLAGIAMGVTAWGLTWVSTSVNVRELLVAGSRVLRDYQWLEERLGPLVPVELVVRFRPESPLDLLERVELLRELESALEGLPELGGTTSAVAFLPAIPKGSGARGTIRRSVLKSRLEARLPELARAHWLSQDAEGQWWRVSTRVPALTNTDYAVFLQQIQARVSAVLDAERPAGVQVIYTGLTVLVEKAQQALLLGMFYSFLGAVALVAVVMIAVQRSLLVGLLAMIPNIFPAVLVFGYMGLQGIKVDIGSVMTASVALGIAVDGTVHYLTWYRRNLASGLPPEKALRRAFEHCAWAMVETTLICALGLLVFAVSDFLPISRFSWMMATLLVAALVGDLVLLPALLINPVGRWLVGLRPVWVAWPVPSKLPAAVVAEGTSR